jgi:predicted nucleic acid-binding protein
VSISLRRFFLDTNIFIIGDADRSSAESFILEAFGYRGKPSSITGEVIFSDELLDQIRRVSKYLYGKEQAGEIISNLWRWLPIYYLPSTLDWTKEKSELAKQKIIPSEDIEIYLTAKNGQADCFISGNRKLIATIAEFNCFTPEDFINEYFSDQ